jgi:hypothetical protein
MGIMFILKTRVKLEQNKNGDNRHELCTHTNDTCFTAFSSVGRREETNNKHLAPQLVFSAVTKEVYPRT